VGVEQVPLEINDGTLNQFKHYQTDKSRIEKYMLVRASATSSWLHACVFYLAIELPGDFGLDIENGEERRKFRGASMDINSFVD